MTLTADRNTTRRDGIEVDLPIAAGEKIFAGSLVARDASGNATPGAVATTLLGMGRAEEYVDNSAGGAGDKTVKIRKGVFQFANSAAGDAITRADIGKECFIVDDQTVAKTDGGTTRSIAGRIDDVDTAGVWVEFTVIPRPATVGSGDMDATLIKYATVNLTNANIKALRAAPVTLVAAQGANKIVELVSAAIKLVAGTEVLTETADNLAVKYENGTGVAISQAIEATGFVDAAVTTVTNALPKIDAIAALSASANKALVLHNTGDGEYGGNATADATMVVKIAYRVHDLA
ncbi:hypothetical protein A2V82_16510 [candidate division KSB1 bacterium RBG_16_48_16]|nr:MAG: hypothetical protein A2V82_16510 [candidate division KSB1 bacterium RBG_16_48_16]